MCAHLLLWELQNYNLLLNNCQQENVVSHQKKKKWRREWDIAHIQRQRRSPSKTVGGAKLDLESNSIPARDAWRAQTKPCMHQETQQRLSQAFLWMFECLLQRYRSKVVCRKGQGLWVQQTWVWHKPFWRRSPLTPPQSCHYLHRTGETDPWRAQTKPVYTRIQKKGPVTPQETDPDLPWVSRSLWPRHWSAVACYRVQGTECGIAYTGPF